MSLWERIKNGWSTDAEHLAFTYITEGDALPAGNAYFRVWLADMFLAKARDWTQDQWPAVHATVQLTYAGEDRARFTKVAQPPKAQLGVGVRNNYPLTPLLPFSGGIVEIESALMKLKGPSPISTAITVLEDFSALVGAPLSTALAVADKVADGMTKLADSSGGSIELGLHHALVSSGGNLSNTLRPGYLVVVGVPSRELHDGALSVREGRLHGSDGEPLTGFDYMVFGVESRTTRDDYASLFSKEFNAAKEAAIYRREAEFTDSSRKLYIAVLTSNDLTEDDRQIQLATYREKLQEYWDTMPGAVPEGDTDDLDELVARMGRPDLHGERLTLADVLAM